MVGQMFSTPQDEFYLRVARGEEPKFSFIEKFGENPDVDTGTFPEDVWGFGWVYNFSTTADIDTLTSDDAGDTQELTIIGQTADYTEVTQTATLNGQSDVILGTPLRRVYRAWNSSATDLAGTAYLRTNGSTATGGVPDTDSTVRLVIVNGDNQTEMAIYTIPKGKRGYFLGGYVAMSRTGNNSAGFTWKIRDPGGVFRVQSRIACIGTGKSSWDYKYPIPVGPIQEGTDIKLTVEMVDANNTGCAGGFTILLEDISS